VATVGEAEVFAAGGVDDLFVAYPLWVEPSTGRRLAALGERATLVVGVDSAEGAEQLARATPGPRPAVLVEVDAGQHRSGTDPASAGAVALAARRAGLEVRGVFTFPGHAYRPGAVAGAADDEARALDGAARSLEAVGIEAPVRSGGSTPSLASTRDSAVTEVRPGVYAFGDAQQVTLGSCTLDQVALAAVGTVVSLGPDRAVLDVGSKVLGADRPAWMDGFGTVPELGGAVVQALSEHHAVVALEGRRPPARGQRLAVVPNHVCSAVDRAAEVVVLARGQVVDRWPVEARGLNR
jgi:D-serine deaminase-like pyridoxal phosphate-dependent protein